MIAKYPCNKGDVFQGFGGMQYTVDDINVEVECGLGIKKAIKYRRLDLTGRLIIDYYVLGIGLVRVGIIQWE